MEKFHNEKQFFISFGKLAIQKHNNNNKNSKKILITHIYKIALRSLLSAWPHNVIMTSQNYFSTEF